MNFEFFDQRTEKDNQLLDLLLWVSGREDNFPDLHLVSVEESLEFLARHRVAGRALKKIKQKSPLAIRLGENFLDSLLQLEVDRNLLRDFHRTSVARDFIVIKGNSAFRLTQDPFTIRPSGDIDLLTSSNASMDTIINSMSGTVRPMPSSHEIVNFFVDGREFDIHKHYPIYQMVTDTNHLSGLPTGLRIVKISYADLFLYCRPGEPCTGGIPAPDATLSAFITATHLFSDLARGYTALIRNRPRIRMSEVLELFDFISHKSFDSTKFNILVEKYQVEAEISIALGVCKTLCGDDFLASLKGIRLHNGYDRVFPLFVWYGMSIPFPNNPYYLLIQSGEYQNLLSNISSDLPKLEDGECFHIGSKDSLYFNSMAETEVPFDLEVFRCDGNIDIRLAFQLSCLGLPHISITLGCDYYRCFIDQHGLPSWRVDGSGRMEVVEFDCSDKSVTLRALISSPSKYKPTYLTIGVGELIDGIEMRRGAFVPIFLP